jgi:DNA repair ATPase RecN
MSFVTSCYRQQMLTARASDLAFMGQSINQARLQLGNTIGNLLNGSANLEPESPQMQQIQAQLAMLQQLDKNLEVQLKRIDTQRQAVVTELEAVQKVLGKAIDSGFKTFATFG